MATTDEVVTISKAEYEELLNRQFKLECLEAGGVDNWAYYDLAMEPFFEANS